MASSLRNGAGSSATASTGLKVKSGPWIPPTQEHPLFNGIFERILQHSRGVDYLVRYPGPSEQDWEEERDAVNYYQWKALTHGQKDISPKYSIDQTIPLPPNSEGAPSIGQKVQWMTNHAP